MNVVDRVVELIPHGKENAISRASLAANAGLGDRQMRDAIERARRKGVLIINDQCGKGYYISSNVKDIERQLRQTHSRAMSLLAQEKYLKRCIKAAEREEEGCENSQYNA